MSDKKPVNKTDDSDKKENTEHVKEAFEQAEKDIEKDPALQPDKDNDLDEGELANKEGHP
ncbi:MAG TPA: hypothetical protein VGW31_02675 [Hanamia sp.]|nr:hypothetical protein [Hanamia sp.]